MMQKDDFSKSEKCAGTGKNDGSENMATCHDRSDSFSSPVPWDSAGTRRSLPGRFGRGAIEAEQIGAS